MNTLFERELSMSRASHPIIPNDLRCLRILMEEVGEVARELDPNSGDPTLLRAEIMQVAVVAYRWLERIESERGA